MKTLAILVTLLLPAMATAQDQAGARYTDSGKERALLEAIRKRDHDAVNVLLSKGVNANAREPGGWSALMSAAETGQVDVARALLAAGADADAHDERGWTALM
ncbi:MAG: ankyrin repeat domain-containing protein, partial [Phycisphaerales bacterium]